MPGLESSRLRCNQTKPYVGGECTRRIHGSKRASFAVFLQAFFFFVHLGGGAELYFVLPSRVDGGTMHTTISRQHVSM